MNKKVGKKYLKDFDQRSFGCENFKSGMIYADGIPMYYIDDDGNEYITAEGYEALNNKIDEETHGVQKERSDKDFKECGQEGSVWRTKRAKSIAANKARRKRKDR